MSKNLQSPTKLTEFAPIQSEEKPKSVGQFITKFFKLSKSAVPEESPSSKSSSDNISQESLPTWAVEGSSESSSPVYQLDVNEERSLPNVLKRISNLLALKSTNPQDYAATDMKQYWMPDSVSKECYECCEKFTTFRRKHHCRVCGQIFCSQCCSHQIPGKVFGCTGDLRVCTYCCKVVLSYLQSSDLGVDLTSDLKSLQENLQSKFSTASLAVGAELRNSSQSLNKTVDVDNLIKRKISVGYQEEKFASGSPSIYLSTEEKCKALQNSATLRALFEEICKPTTGISLGTHRYRLRTYTDCFFGSELVDWLICQQKANTRVQASAICQAFLEGSYIECVSEPCSFIDGYALYKLGSFSSSDFASPLQNYIDLPMDKEPIWIQQIPQESSTTDSENEMSTKRPQLASSSSYTLDLNVEASSVYLSRPTQSNYSLESQESLEECDSKEVATVRTSEQREFVPVSGWFNAHDLREENGEKCAYELLKEAYQQHELGLLKHLLSAASLSLSWTDIVIPLVHSIVSVIRPDKNHDAEDLDVRHYIKFKKLTGGSRTDTRLVNGIVFSKNVAHKGMATEIANPKILLLQCSVVYQRTEGRLMSLEPVLMQEHEYLRHVAARIVALQPNIVLVQRNVSRLAQDLLRVHGITLVHNVKQSILDQLARCTEADLVTAVDAHIGRPRLGTCKRFHLKQYATERGAFKNLMFFEGLPLPHLGGSVLLRGGTKGDLSRLKSVVALCTFAAYNWRLEQSFLMDAFAQPPESRCEFLDDSKESSPTLPKTETAFRQKSSEDPPAGKKTFSNPDDTRKVSVEVVEDFTDPLQSYANCDRALAVNNVSETLSVEKLPFSNHFRKALDDTILCCSPYLRFAIPYLETEVGRKCKLRHFFPSEIYFSEQFMNVARKVLMKEMEEEVQEARAKEKKPLHQFLLAKFTSGVESNEIQALLAHFRASGSSYEKREVLCKPAMGMEEDKLKKEKVFVNRSDVLEINNHQRLAVLFCSFSHESQNAPAFCVNPWIVNMNFYGSNDIPLGFFLEKYCFRPTYNCPSKSCGVPMSRHIRRFVHNAGCVTISINSGYHSTEETIVMWTWCKLCQMASPVVPMSGDTWSFSFAKYLELKFYGSIYSRRGVSPCKHSLLQDHDQYFAYKNCVTFFEYRSVQIWEISLPPPVIEINYDIDKYQSEMIDEIRTMAQRGHEVYSIILEKLTYMPTELDGLGNLKQLLLSEQAQFRQCVEEVQLKLTSPTIEKKEFGQADPTSHWKISDSLVRIKRMVVDTVDTWNVRLSETLRKKENDCKKTRNSHGDPDSPTTLPETSLQLLQSLPEPEESANPAESDQVSILARKKIKSLDQTESEPCGFSPSHQRSQSDGTVMSTAAPDELQDVKKDNSDKKTVKTILSQLLPPSPGLAMISSPFNAQDHFTLPAGVFLPIAVYESEPSSIIAYALNSYDYKKSLEDFQKSLSQEQTPSPVPKRKTQNSAKSDNNDEKKSEEKKVDEKKQKNHHIEVQFEDSNCNFYCRIYFAEQFAAIRAQVLPMGEEAYIRSLSRSVQWNARGGKSGSNFAKTLDDRLVLKEMSKSEVQLFLESASNYFAYMTKCVANGQPTLLGKIAGIYQIVFKNNSNATLRTNLLVMENLFYKRTVSQKFDLKGSMRNRLVNPDNQEGEIVLLDENLLKSMTCEAPLYVLSHSKAVLTAAIQNDTEFLAAQSVMDYSLLVGLDVDNKELVLGIIDYIRTFTWDKKLETMVKKSGILGGQGKLPTIVSPEEYQKRFIEAMHRYFLEVPDHWAGLGKGLEY